MNDPVLYRRRLIPRECVRLKDDVILLNRPGLLVTGWKALKPRRDLHHGFSVYSLERGFKLSRFYDADNRLLYHYCDIITSEYDEASGSLTVTDLLADVIIYPDGSIRVVDIGELAEALNQGLLSLPLLQSALTSLHELLNELYTGSLPALTDVLEPFDPYFSVAAGLKANS